jgi:transketolase
MSDLMVLESQSIRLDERSIYLRELVIDALEGGGRGHVGATLSLIEIFRVLYDEILRVRPDEPDWPERDRCILSKGHGCLALYALLADKGFFDKAELGRQCRAEAMLGGHPERAHIPGVEASTGALGHGLSIGIGIALALRLKRSAARVYVVMGDGELDEGAVWEAAMSAAKHRLGNLTALVDYNKLQSYGPVAEVMPLEPLADKWRSFGFHVAEVNGHDVADLRAGLMGVAAVADRPSIVICHTVKGKGFDMAEGNAAWHHKAKVRAEDVSEMRDALRRH